MIWLYSGTPGSGKSLHAASFIRNRLRAGVPVISNFDFDWQSATVGSRRKATYIHVDLFKLNPQFLTWYAMTWWRHHKHREGGIVLLIDECQLIFNCRSWDGKERAAWLRFFTEHRKLGYEVILVAQFDRMIDRQIRSLIEYQIVHRKVSNFGLYGRIVGLFFGGKLFIQVKVWYPMKEVVGHEFFFYRRKVGRLYDTLQMH